MIAEKSLQAFVAIKMFPRTSDFRVIHAKKREKTIKQINKNISKAYFFDRKREFMLIREV